MEKTPTLITFIQYTHGIKSLCSVCQKTLVQGSYALQMTFEGREYLVGHTPPLFCCDDERHAPVIFDSKEEAVAAIPPVVAQYEKDKGIDNINLIDVVITESHTLQ